MLADRAFWKMRRDDLAKIVDNHRISVCKAGRRSGETAFGDQVREQTNQLDWPALIATKGWHRARHCDRAPDPQLAEWNPAFYGQKRMITCCVERAPATRAYPKAWLHTAVDP